MPCSIVALYAARPLEAAVETATIHLIDWLVTEHGFSATDAYCLVSTCPEFRINVYQMWHIMQFIDDTEVAQSDVVIGLLGAGTPPATPLMSGVPR
jgi:hypothetical protein